MRTTKHKPRHCWVFKAMWRATSLKLKIEANDLEHAYRKAENMVLRMEGGSLCEKVECVEQKW